MSPETIAQLLSWALSSDRNRRLRFHENYDTEYDLGGCVLFF